MDNLTGFLIISLIVIAYSVAAYYRVADKNPLFKLYDLKLSTLPEDLCHYCLNKITTNSRIQRRCPNCNEYGTFHAHCGMHLCTMEKRCHGVLVGDKSGHSFSLKYRSLCATCGLKQKDWDEWVCGDPYSHRRKAVAFTAKDEVLLRRMGISACVDIETNQKRNYAMDRFQ